MVPVPVASAGARRRARTARPLALAVLVAGLAAPAAAEAKTATGTVTVNKGYTLVARSTPSNGGAVVRQLQNGAKVNILCQTEGEKVAGRFGTSKIWDQLEGGGYVSDTFVYTGSDGRVASACAADAAPEKPAAPAEPSAPATGAQTGAEAGGAIGTGGSSKKVAKVTLKNDYPYPTRSWGAVDPWNFFYRECTSFVAYRLSRNIKGFNNQWGKKDGKAFGNAEDWDNRARALGYVVDTTPTKGSVMVRNSGRSGHVAVVAKVGKGGKFYVEQYNAGGTHNYSKQWLTKTGVMTFIHFDRKK
ncbi:CHAP domain-containing protein [Patulibacter sp. NPDC049589]|uniref:CHAP domain-containing protein n=1 Tax=Patulibacter sp. NPDC049589 TaxID=3154731 RepID=UPI003446BAF7